MEGKISSGQLVTVEPIRVTPIVGDIVLCKVKGKHYLHLIKAISSDNQFQIGNNFGRINGWISSGAIYGKCTDVSD